MRKILSRITKEEKASGISPPYSALDQLIEDCIELEKLEDEVRQKDGKKIYLGYIFRYLN